MIEKLFILTGEKHSGKTSRLQRFLETYTGIAGILMPVMNGKRFFLDIESGVVWPAEADTDDDNVLAVGRFRFSKPAFDRANDIIIQAVHDRKDMIIIDEIGPLELEMRQGLHDGWMACVNATPPMQNLLLVVRREMVDELLLACSGQFRDCELWDGNALQPSAMDSG